MARYQKILLVDDHGITREGAALHLRALDPAIEIFHARSVEEGQRQVLATNPDLLFLDLRFDDDHSGGLRLLRWIKQGDTHDHVPIIIMSGEALDRRGVEALLEDGAAGYLAKGKADSADIFRIALMALEAGAVFIHGARTTAVAGNGASGNCIGSPPAPRDAKSLGLIPSHQRVLVRHVRGMPYKRIARELDITEATVKEYISDICRRFKVDNAKALIYEIARAGVALEDA